VHGFAQSIIQISDRLVGFSKPYFNESAEKLLENFASYVRNVNQSFTETQSLKEVKEKSMEEAKTVFEYIWYTFSHLASLSTKSFNKESHLKGE